MSNPYSEPTPSAPYQSPVPLPPVPGQTQSGRPVGVTVFAILCFVFAGLAALGLLSTIGMLMAGGNAVSQNPVLELCRTNTVYMLVTVVTNVLGVVFLCVQVAAGFGLLKMAPRGRTLILWYAVYAMVMAVVSNAINYVYLFPLMREQMAKQSAGAPPAAQQIVEASMMFGFVIGLLFAFLFPLCILWYFNRSDIKARFAAAN